ncbi:BQ5605_C031g10946 [Microbotryum silenes-dioicae]|uniref:BQ5605_C031g10946 protein n=1 Tax=Microbotryum silenes-dioicae TaxID=796604 RepID=A0A2X0PBZ8_9BASI|nr:BQ5605_C031g10946 [Microbotryum silenes-dioicae]
MVRSFALVKIYGMAREGRSLVSGQYPRVKARLVSLYWIAFLSAPTAQQPALEIQPREDIRRCRGDEIAIYEPQSKKKKKIAARSVLCDALGLDTIDNTHYTAVQRMFGLPKLKASLRDQEGAGRTIEIFTGLVLEMISSGRWGMQKWGTRMEGVVRRRIILEERLKLRAGGAWGRRGQ